MEIILNKKNSKFGFLLTDRENHLNIKASDFLEEGNKGFRPMQLLLGGIASCLSIDFLNILYKKRLQIEQWEVVVKGVREEELPKAFTEIQIAFNIKGTINQSVAEKALKLSKEKYCSVIHSLHPQIAISTSINIDK
ncbi:MAG: OsmC family protein [Flavobacteriales bacterium]|jgi:putative redox protein|nr:OsmC family protein [Flavobacteriales bacterium]